jgi:anaerobic magnesium-protoporphyrin IX monomethyl ester cyclase
LTDRCRVALVDPDFPGSFHGTPLCLAYLGAALENAGHEVRIFDFYGDGMSSQSQAQEVYAFRPDVVGITGTSPSLLEAVAFKAAYRRQDGHAWLVKGGHHERRESGAGEMSPDEWELQPEGEFVVTAPHGEAALVQLVDECSQGRSWWQVKAIPGIPRRATAGPATPAGPAMLADARLLPARHLLDRPDRYEYRGIFDGLKATQMLTYRGCRFTCSFCAISNLELNHAEAAIESDIRTIKEMGYQAVFLDDATFTRQWERAERVMQHLKAAGLVWACQTRIDCVKPDRLKLMRDTGCTYLYYGLESGSPRVQIAINKKQHYDRTIDTIRLTRALGMTAVTSFIFGVPLGNDASEDETDWAKSVELIRAARPSHVVPSIFAYYPQSPEWSNLAPARKDDYWKGGKGVNRGSEWHWFDDGYGSIHHVTAERAQEIRAYLEHEIPEFLWTEDTAPAAAAAPTERPH